MAQFLIRTFQQDQLAWATRNFGESPSDHPLIGVIEEIGELSHAILKRIQQIRGSSDQHEAAAKDAIADDIVFFTQYCALKGWDLAELLGVETFRELQNRAESKGVRIGQTRPPCIQVLFEMVRGLGKVAGAECDGSNDAGRVATVTTFEKLASFCTVKGWDLEAIVEDTWKIVSQRDWTLNKQNGESAASQLPGDSGV